MIKVFRRTLVLGNPLALLSKSSKVRRMLSRLLLLLSIALATTPHVNAQEDDALHLPLVVGGLQSPGPSTGPTIHSFIAEPSTVAPGGESILRWQVTGATTLSILPTIGTVSGTSAPINPITTTEYTLTASNTVGSTTAKTTVTVIEDVTTEGALWLPYSLINNDPLATYGTSVAVDANNGMHAAYSIFIGSENGTRPASYAYCQPSSTHSCTDLDNWGRVKLGDYIQDVRLVLNAAGHPRLMLFGPVDPLDEGSRSQYQYAECNANCTEVANWTITTINTPREIIFTREEENNDYFAINQQGHLAFLYTDEDPAHFGTFYVACAATCTNQQNWVETHLSSGYVMDEISLDFAPSGEPRMAFGWRNDPLYSYPRLTYVQCDSGCTTFEAVTFDLLHGTAQYNLQVGNDGHPRLALYVGSNDTGQENDYDPLSIYYFWCKGICTGNAPEWFYAKVSVPGSVGGEIDLALDTQNRPRISFLNAAGLAYAWCDVDCETGAPAWQYQVVESNASLADNYEVLPIHYCTVSAWINGNRTSLALDAAGHPHIGYDADHIWSGVYVNEPTKNCDVTDITMTRFAFFKQP